MYTCSVAIRASQAGGNKQVRVFIVSLGSAGRLDERAFVSRVIDQNTDEDGFLVVELPWSSIPGVGKYRVRLIDIETGEVLHDRVCTVPDVESVVDTWEDGETWDDTETFVDGSTLDYEDLPSTISVGADTTGSILIRESDGTPSGAISTLIVPSGSLTVTGGTGTLQFSGGGGSGANLTASTTSTTVVIASDSGTDATLATASGTVAGIMTAAQFTKLSGIATGATANSADATLLARANHTGTQAWSTITSTPTTLSGYGISDSITSAAVAAGYQPLDSDLTAIAALTTTSFGRSLLTQADAAATRTTIGAGTSSFDGAYSSLSGIPSTFTPSAHNQDASTITTGTLPVGRGGTALTAVGAGHTVLRTNHAGSALEFASGVKLLGQSPTIAYDGSNRVSTLTYSDGSVKTLTYNGSGQVTQSDHVYTSPARTYRKAFAYDGSNRLTSVTESIV